MALFTTVLERSQKRYPALTIKYKDESLLMKAIAKALFFNKKFMDFTTTLGSTIYLPSAAKLRKFPVSNSIILLHEVSHIHESDKKSKLLFGLLYLFPQILALLAIPAFILFGWKLALLCLVFLAPIPAYFRMKEEMQAYIVSLYVMNKLNNLYNFKINLNEHKDIFVKEFSNANYYYMWPLPGVETEFTAALDEIKANGKPKYDPALYEIIDNILEG